MECVQMRYFGKVIETPFPKIDVMFRFMLLVVISIAFAGQLSAQEEGIVFFTGSWEAAKEKAQAEQKLLFVDAYTAWCGPCKWMDKNVFTNANVGAYFNEYFVNYKLDMEKGEGPAFAKEYTVRAYPTMLFIAPSGDVVHRIMGSRQANQLIEVGETALQKRQ